MNHKWTIGLVIVTLLVFLFWPSKERSPQHTGNLLVPWQVEITAEGHSRVLGLELGRSTPAEASQVFGQRGELALFADSSGNLSAEGFFSELTSGGLSGRIIFGLQLDKAELETMALRADKRKTLDSGSIKYWPNREDRLRLLTLPISSLTYIPYIDLDQGIIESRFGVAEQRLQGEHGQSHFLYPQKGIDIILDPAGKEVIQFVNPEDFSRLRMPLNESLSGH